MTKSYARLKHRKEGDYRDVPLPASVKRSIEWCAHTCGTTDDGYLLPSTRDISRPFGGWVITEQWQKIKEFGEVDIPDGMVVHGLRHFFASNCLANNIPITDVAE
ncbi:hypothetical protein ACIRYZ_44670 [Kitasatospora sp. NPDC101155]|uniref:hypothetical protein n=1 Tax=Kitasatospora sp. NPDC101155 TaxID=3364097 RepID=UPI003815F2AF